MHLSAVTPKPQKPARRLVRRAPTTAPGTGLKKVEKKIKTRCTAPWGLAGS